MSTLLPDCMMPDGADPCAAFTQQIEEIERLRAALEEIAGDPTGISSYQAELAKQALDPA